MPRFLPIFIITLATVACEDSSQSPSQTRVADTTQDNQPNQNDDTGSLLDQDSTSFKDRIDEFSNTPPPNTNKIPVGSFQTVKPSTWFWVPRKSHVVDINYIAPSPGKSEPATFSATAFAIGEGGHFTDNVKRWKAMFRSNDGSPVRPALSVIQVNGHDAVVAEFEGEYMGAGAAWHLDDYAMLVSEIREPDGNMYLKLLGPKSTVDFHKDSFFEVVTNLQRNR